MKGLFVVGLSHKTAPVEVRERFSVLENELGDVLQEIRHLEGVNGVFATSTCNRFEVYASAQDVEVGVGSVETWLRRHPQAGADPVERYLYRYRGEDAVRHLFRVAASLDSLVVGEAQILGQVKAAFRAAERAGTLDGHLNRCLSRALRVAKAVRTETGIARHPVSVPQVAVELAKKVFGQLSGRTVVVLGAGKMSRVAARNLRGEGVAKIYVANRSVAKARELAAELDAEPSGLDELQQLLVQADIVICSTASREPVIRAQMVRGALKERRYRPLFLVDVAVPRDVEAACGQLSNVYLFDIDDLQQVVESNLGQRQKEAREGERIVSQKAAQFSRLLHVDPVTPVIVELRQKLQGIKDEELKRALDGLNGLDPKDAERVRRLANTLVNRILHEPTIALKRLAQEGAGDEAAELVHFLFDLDADD